MPDKPVGPDGSGRRRIPENSAYRKMARMKRWGFLFASLAIALVLLMGVGGAAVAHGDPADHHGIHPAPSQSVPLHDGSVPQKMSLWVVAPCCPAAEVPTDQALALPMTVGEISWQTWPAVIPDICDITPDPPPPKLPL